MPRPWRASRAVPSDQFARAWDLLEELRKKKGLSEEEAAVANGFVRSTWFAYKKHGSIPIGLLEAVTKSLGGSLELSVITEMSGATGTSGESTEETDVSEESIRIARMLDELPDGARRQRLVNMFEGMIALERVNASHPPDPVAEEERASRGRSSKS